MQPKLPKVTPQCDILLASSQHWMSQLVSLHQWHWMLPPLPWNPDVTTTAANAVATTIKMDSPLSLLLCFFSSRLQVWEECVQLLERSHLGK